MDKLNLTILMSEQVYGENKLKIFEHIDPRAALTDTAILRGANITDFHVDGDDTLSGRTGYYWLQNSDWDGYARCVDSDGMCNFASYNSRTGSVRAALPSSFVLKYAQNIIKGQDGLQRAELGYYSGQALDEKMQIMLEKMYVNNTLTKLGKGCTFDARVFYEHDKDFLPEEQIYYGYQGNIYARVRANSCSGQYEFVLSNSKNYKYDDYVWTKIEPVTWIRHPEDDYFISEKAFVSGIRFYKELGTYVGDFNKTELKWFLDNHLSKDLVNPIVYNYLNNWSKQKQTVNYFIYKDANGTEKLK